MASVRARCGCQAPRSPAARPWARPLRRRAAPLRAAGGSEGGAEDTISKLDALLAGSSKPTEAPEAEQGEQVAQEAQEGGDYLYVDDDELYVNDNEMERQKDNVSDAMKVRQAAAGRRARGGGSGPELILPPPSATSLPARSPLGRALTRAICAYPCPARAAAGGCLQERLRREVGGLYDEQGTQGGDGNPFLTSLLVGGTIILLGAWVTGSL